MLRRVLIVIAGLGLLAALAGCGAEPPPPAPTPPPLADELIFYDWVGDMPQSVLDAFTAEYGIEVTYLTYESQEEAADNMRAGVAYDVVVMENLFIPSLVREGLVAEIDFHNVPNFKNISANFRDLTSDPGNRHTVPFNWGTTGLVVRSDLAAEPVTRWADLWDPGYAGRVALWNGQPRELLGLTLKSLGYSANSEEPAELEAALERLLALKPNVFFLEDLDAVSSAPYLASGEAVLAMGWAFDVLDGREQNPAIAYVLPEEGALLWGDNFVIPANSSNKYSAELFLNFLLRPEIGAQIANENLYATPNEAAWPFIDPEILNDPVVFPPNDDLQNAEIILPLSPAGQELYAGIWDRFMAAPR